MAETALIVGAGPGLSAAVARRFAAEGIGVSLAARDTDKLAELCGEIGATAHQCDVTDQDQVEALFDAVGAASGVPDIVMFNASARVGGGIAEVDPEAVLNSLKITGFGGFLVGQAAAKRMIERGSGTILITGSSASVKGYPGSPSNALAKFSLRGLAQSMARELQPKNIHVAHVVVDGGIGIPGVTRPDNRGPDGWLHPDALAETYLQLHRQHRSAWSWEIELRPWAETF